MTERNDVDERREVKRGIIFQRKTGRRKLWKGNKFDKRFSVCKLLGQLVSDLWCDEKVRIYQTLITSSESVELGLELQNHMCQIQGSLA